MLAAACLFAADKEKEEVKLPTSPEDLARGKALYDAGCQLCHGPKGDGGKGTNLAQAKLPRATKDSDLVRVIEVGIVGTEMPGAWHMTQREMTQVAAYVRTLGKVAIEKVPGAPAAGRQVFGKGGCAACHTVKNEQGVRAGGLMGPDLSEIGGRRGAAHLRESLVSPAASVPDYFLDTEVALKSGRTVKGRRLNEDTFVVVVQDYQGNNHVIDKSTVASLKKDMKASPMPSYRDKLSPDELTNLIAYLASLREAR
jgi:putative heme-binding domain-containing protein